MGDSVKITYMTFFARIVSAALASAVTRLANLHRYFVFSRGRHRR
jgi:hypothetical protein